MRSLALVALFVSLSVAAAHAQQGLSQAYPKQKVLQRSRNIEEIPTRHGTAANLATYTIEEIGGCWTSDPGSDAMPLGDYRIVNSPEVLKAWIDVCEGRAPSLSSLLLGSHYGPMESLTEHGGVCYCIVSDAEQICDQSQWADSAQTSQPSSNSIDEITYNPANGILVVEKDFFCLFRLQVGSAAELDQLRHATHLKFKAKNCDSFDRLLGESDGAPGAEP